MTTSGTTPQSEVSTRYSESASATRAGCANPLRSISAVGSGPNKAIASEAPLHSGNEASTSLHSSMAARNVAEKEYSLLAIPTYCEPWPVKVKTM